MEYMTALFLAYFTVYIVSSMKDIKSRLFFFKDYILYHCVACNLLGPLVVDLPVSNHRL